MPKTFPTELYHYTGIAGLQGIIQNQTLWATHYKHLNDTQEVIQFEQRLSKILQPIFTNLFTGLSRKQTETLFSIYDTVENAIDCEARKLAAALYQTTFKGGEKNRPFAEPYIVSFWRPDNENARQHGRLSLWRAYGRDGLVIVFDAPALISLLKEEGQRWAYSAAFGGDVVYESDSDADMLDEFEQHIDRIKTSLEKAIRLGSPKPLDDAYVCILACASRYKHWAFDEEREFRLVVVPTPVEVVELARKNGIRILPDKPISRFLRNGTSIPYLNLFDGITAPSGKQLPIKRIIVGPHSDIEKSAIEVRNLLRLNRLNVEISISNIPYTG